MNSSCMACPKVPVSWDPLALPSLAELWPCPHHWKPTCCHGITIVNGKQCSGSESGSVCFWASWILLSSSKNSKKILILSCFVTFDFLSMKNDVRVHVSSKSNKQKNFFKKFFVGVLKVNDENSRIRIRNPDPYPLVRGMDSGIRNRIYTKMSWIRNTDDKYCIKKERKTLS